MARPFTRHKQSTGLFVSGLSFDELRQIGAGLSLSLREESRRVLLHQTVQRGLFLAMTIVVDRGAIRRPLGLPANGLHDGLPEW